MLKYAVSLPRIRFVQMVVVDETVLWTQRLIFFLRFMVQSLHVDKLKPCQLTLKYLWVIHNLRFDPEYKKRFLHHYTSSYLVGERGHYGAPGRREIVTEPQGERALAQVPSKCWRVPMPSVSSRSLGVKWFFLASFLFVQEPWLLWLVVVCTD